MHIVRYVDSRVHWGSLEEDGTILPLLGSPFESLAMFGAPTRLDSVSLLTPIEPRFIYCVGRNYLDHVAEIDPNHNVPKIPMLFAKPPDTAVGHEAPIVYPRDGKLVHYEGELAVIIGRTARRLSEADALSCVLGYTCANDVSERIVQRMEMPQGALLMGKSFDSFCPLGPVIATDIDPTRLTLTTRLNGETRQSANTADMIFSVAKLISYMSQGMTLRPGDVIITGTPSGVGPMVPGDTVEVSITGIGTLRNRVVAAESDIAHR